MNQAGRQLFVGHDLGTGGVKSVLVDAGGAIVASAFADYPLDHPQPGWAEQQPDDWWEAVCLTTRTLLAESGVPPEDVAGIAFAGQMLVLVPLDADGEPTRPAISWLDGRAEAQARALMRRVGGRRVMKAAVGALPTGKDLICKIAWLREHEPDVYDRTASFCDATGYLVARATGVVSIDESGAAATGLLDRKRRRWSRPLAKLAGADLSKFPDVVPSAQVVGGVTADAADRLGVPAGTPVVAGMGDIVAAGIGSGATAVGQAHVYLGTSGWICPVADRPRDLPRNGVYALPSPQPGRYLMVGETETAGACLEWLARLVELHDEEGGPHYSDLEELLQLSEPGSGGLLFAPWLFGERAPVSDAELRGAFAGISLEHRREQIARAVVEGVALNLGWLLDAFGDSVDPGVSLRAIGGGAQSPTWVQTIADVTGRSVAVVNEPQQAGAVGAALLAAVGVGALPGVEAIGELVAVDRVQEPNPAHRDTYDVLGRALRELQPALATASRRLEPLRRER